MRDLTPSQKAVVTKITGICRDFAHNRTRTYLLIGEPGSGKTYLGQHLQRVKQCRCWNMVEDEWSSQLADPASALDYLRSVFIQKSGGSALLIDGFSAIHQLHGDKWAKETLRDFSETPVTGTVFLIVTYSDEPHSPHLSRKDITQSFDNENRILDLPFDFKDASAVCSAMNIIPKAALNLHELRILAEVRGG